MAEEGLTLRRLEEALASVPDLECREDGALGDLADLHPEPEHALEGGQLVLDGPERGPRVLPRADVGFQAIGRDVMGPITSEEAPEPCDRERHGGEGLPLIDPVIVEQHLGQILERGLVRVGADQPTLAHLGQAFPEQPDGVGALERAGGFAVRLAPMRILDPPGLRAFPLARPGVAVRGLVDAPEAPMLPRVGMAPLSCPRRSDWVAHGETRSPSPSSSLRVVTRVAEIIAAFDPELHGRVL
jgi:hypothetical protein